MFQLILPFQLELQFEADVAPSARGAGRTALAPRVSRTRRIRRERACASLAFEFRPALEEE